MAESFAIRIGPVCVALRGEFDSSRWTLDAGHHKFHSPTSCPHVTLQIEWEFGGQPTGRPVFQTGRVASFYVSEGQWSVRLGEDEEFHAADRILYLERAGAAGRIVMDPDRFPDPATRYPLEYPLEELLFRHLLADRGSLLVHACGVASGGAGYLFVGSSGAGKSTTARRWRAAGATILNDDRIVLETNCDGVRIHPTPWFGEHPDVGGDAAPLRAIYLLRQGSGVAFEPVRPAKAAALVFAKSFPPLWDPERVERTLAALGDACQRVPCGWLSVPPDARAVEWVLAQR